MPEISFYIVFLDCLIFFISTKISTTIYGIPTLQPVPLSLPSIMQHWIQGPAVERGQTQ